MLSPIPEIYNDSKANVTGAHKSAVDRLLKKMFASTLADDSDELAVIMNTFWDEFEHFKSKTGPYAKPYIWNLQNKDLQHGKSYLWHKKNSFENTAILGKLACRVCSKIVGMGSAERNWGDVKHIKSAKRSHLSADRVEKQAIIFGASCMEDADLERKIAKENSNEPYKFWDEKDFDEEFDMLADHDGRKTNKPKRRYVKCYLEEWEK